MVLLESVLLESQNYKRKYHCPYCDKRYTRDKLSRHIEDKHEDLLAEGDSPSRIAFNVINRYPMNHVAHCVVCGKEALWDDNKCRYNRLCEDPRCKIKYKEMVENRIRKTHNGKSSRDLLMDPEFQSTMLAGRRISGEYIWSDKSKKSYVGQYERKCLEFMDKVLHCRSEDVRTPGPTVDYLYNGEMHKWITDIYYEPYNLAIDCKDGGDNPNNRDMPEYRAKQVAKEEAIDKDKKYNYLRLTDNNFSQLISIFAELKLLMMQDSSPSVDDRIVRIHENMPISSMNPMVGSDVAYIVRNKMHNGVFEEGISDDITLDHIFMQRGDKIEDISYKDLNEYEVYAYRDKKNNREKIKECKESVFPHYVYETLFEKKYYTDDQILVEDIMPILDYPKYRNMITIANQSITEATLRDSITNHIDVPTVAILDDNMMEYWNENGYFLKNNKTGLRTEYKEKSNSYSVLEKAYIHLGELL